MVWDELDFVEMIYLVKLYGWKLFGKVHLLVDLWMSWNRGLLALSVPDWVLTMKPKFLLWLKNWTSFVHAPLIFSFSRTTKNKSHPSVKFFYCICLQSLCLNRFFLWFGCKVSHVFENIFHISIFPLSLPEKVKCCA